MKHIVRVIFLGLLMKAPSIGAQSIIFNKVLPPEGETFLHITGMVQDKLGYMWLATKKGLYRYDGYNFVSYKNEPFNPNSLASNALESICLDPSGILWIGTFGSGLDSFDPTTGRFTHYHYDSRIAASLSSDTIATILVDSKNLLWVGTAKGLDLFDPASGTATHYRHEVNDSNTLSSNVVRTIFEDRQGTLWVGTGSAYLEPGESETEGGLNRMHGRSGKFTRYVHEPNNPHSLVNNKVSALYEDSKGNFWVGTAGDGLHILNRLTGMFERFAYDAAHPEKLSRPPLNPTLRYDHISFIKEDAGGAIWIGASDAGINRYDPTTKTTRHFESNTVIHYQNFGEFDDNTSWFACSSSDGNFWISTVLGNLFRIAPFNRSLPFISTGSTVNSFFEEEPGILWAATGNGLSVTDSSRRDSRMFSIFKSLKTLNNSFTRSIKDSEGNLWLCSTDGLYKLEPTNQNVIHYSHIPEKPRSLANNFVTAAIQDRRGNIWVSTIRGLDLMTNEGGEFSHFKPVPGASDSLGANFISSLLEDKTGKFWAGGFGPLGLYQFDVKTGKFKSYLVGLSVRAIYEDAAGTVWAGADDGLYRYDPSSDVFSRFIDPSSPRPIDKVISMIEDNEGRLWLGTSTGILQLNRQRTQTTFYGRNYNVNGNTLTYAVYKNRKGHLLFGTTTGYYVIDPANVFTNSRPPKVVITGFRIADKLVNPGPNAPLSEPVSQATRIRLDYSQNVFSFDFVAFDYTNPAENRYLFMLENYDNTWHQAVSDRRASFYKVPPGKYIFRVKASNSDGIWSEKSIMLIITPPWWRSWWAYTLYGVFFIATAYFFNRMIRNRIIEKEKAKTRERELLQAKEIEKAYRELQLTQDQLVQSEKMASLGELTAGIAHEIQNPLNFVNNFSEVNKELADELRSELANGNIQSANEIAADIQMNAEKINQHGKRVDSIVKSMLQHSRSSSGVKEPTDINALCDEYLRLAYHGFRAKEKGFNVIPISIGTETDFDPMIGKIEVIPQDIGRVLLNLFNNALYSVAEKQKIMAGHYEPTVSVRTKRNSDSIEISIKDNGKGIPKEIADKIFQPFFTTKPTGQGTGLGLSLAYDIVTKSHGGQLIVKTVDPEGAEFIIKLPGGRR